MKTSEKVDPVVSDIKKAFRETGIKEEHRPTKRELIGEMKTLIDTGNNSAELKRRVGRIVENTPDLKEVRREAEAALGVEQYLGEYLDD